MTSALHQYLDHVRTRLLHRQIAWMAVAGPLALAALSVGAVWWVSNHVAWFRTLPWLGLAAGVLVVVALLVGGWWLTRRTTVAMAVRVAERDAGFDGRLRTWFDEARRGGAPLLLPLLARDAEAHALNTPPAMLVRWPALALPWALSALALALLIWLGTGYSGASMLRQAWFGALVPNAEPQLRVAPGSVSLPRGMDVRLHIETRSLGTALPTVHALYADEEQWQNASSRPLPGTDGAFEFAFVGVDRPLRYFVSAAGLASAEYQVQVVDLPRITGIDSTLVPPAWTGLPESTQRGGDLRALKGTRVLVNVRSDLPLHNTALQVNGRVSPISLGEGGNAAHGEFEVDEEGRWQVVAQHEGEWLGISETFAIRVLSDAAPQLELTAPGRDWQATAIEEVTTRFRARDDYGLNELTLRYSVNGGDFIDAPVPVSAREAKATAAAGAAETSTTVSDAVTQPPAVLTQDIEHLFDLEQHDLTPGDLIAYYLQAKDHNNTAQSDMYFVEVRPFERGYQDSQQSGSGGERDGSGMDTARRQREIVTAIWNLQRGRERGDRSEDEVHRHREMLSELQLRLQSQVLVVIDRAKNRSLDTASETTRYVESMEAAALAMGPAAEYLREGDLSQALSPAQQALQHLLRAAAGARNVSVSLQSGGGGGGAGRSLGELIELELDTERNRYESGQSAQGEASEQREQDEASLKELEKLAARQEKLADQLGNTEQLLQSRWQQEVLRQELEQLREQLQRQRGSAQSGDASTRSSGAQGQSDGQSGNRRERAQQDLERAAEALQSAERDPERAAELAAEASRAMRRASEELARGQQQQLEGELQELEQRADELQQQQQGLARRLEQGMRELLDGGGARADGRDGDSQAEAGSDASGEPGEDAPFTVTPYGSNWRELQRVASEKGAQRQAYQRLEGDLRELAQRESPGAVGSALTDALDELSRERLSERMSVAEDAIREGAGLYITTSESQVTFALQRLVRQLGVARSLAADQSSETSEQSDPLDAVQRLRAEIGRDDGRADAVNEELRKLIDALPANSVDAEELERLRRTDWNYLGLGLSGNSAERLAKDVRAKLDQLEVALRARNAKAAVSGIGHAPADDAAAEYFRQLSCQEGRCVSP